MNEIKLKDLIRISTAFVLCLTVISAMSSCSWLPSENDYSDDNDYDYGYSDSISLLEAISVAQDSIKVQNAIASAWGLKQYHEPDWGVCTARESGDSWVVTLKGNISGYTDEYQKDFVYDKGFSVEVTVSSYGTVTYVGYVSKVY